MPSRSVADSRYVAGRYTSVSTVIPVRPADIACQGRLDVRGHLGDVRVGEALDDEHEAALALAGGVTDQRLVVLEHVGDVTEPLGRHRPRPRSRRRRVRRRW